MTGSAEPTRVLVVGANHRSSSAMLRDRLFVDDAAAGEFLAGLAQAGVGECLVMSTCDRVEVQAASAAPGAIDAIRQAFAAHGEVPAAEVAAQTYAHVDDEAVRRVFAVAASLDSMIIGEPQVLGQLKASHRVARAAGTMGPTLEAVLQAAYGAAKRVRGETTIAEGPVSIAAAAANVARGVHGDLAAARALLVGGGDMGAMIAEKLNEVGLGGLTVAAATLTRAEALARPFGCQSVTYDALAVAVANADIVLAAAGTGHHLIGAELVEGALRQRRRRPIFLVDTAIPGDVEPAVEHLEEAFLYDLDDLEAVAQQGRATREAAAHHAWEVLEQALADFGRAQGERAAVPAVTALRRRFEAARDEVLDAAPDDAAEATRLLVNRLLHEPSAALRAAAAQDGDDGLAAAARRLFRLTGAADKETDPEEGSS